MRVSGGDHSTAPWPGRWSLKDLILLDGERALLALGQQGSVYLDRYCSPKVSRARQPMGERSASLMDSCLLGRATVTAHLAEACWGRYDEIAVGGWSSSSRSPSMELRECRNIAEEGLPMHGYGR